jgi:hypothetical protein
MRPQWRQRNQREENGEHDAKRAVRGTFGLSVAFEVFVRGHLYSSLSPISVWTIRRATVLAGVMPS